MCLLVPENIYMLFHMRFVPHALNKSTRFEQQNTLHTNARLLNKITHVEQKKVCWKKYAREKKAHVSNYSMHIKWNHARQT